MGQPPFRADTGLQSRKAQVKGKDGPVKGIVVALACLAALPALAEPAIRPPDEARLDGFDAALGAALRSALADGAPEDVRTLAAVLAGAPGEVAPEGAWSCRTIKLGGAPALTVYGAFRCRIEAAGGGWRIVKETGSQRLDGRILRAEDQWIYLGVGFVDGGPATDYAGLPPLDQSPAEPGQTVAQVGVFEQVGATRARLLLPSPLLESGFDILSLTR
jgi:hypothetical protein